MEYMNEPATRKLLGHGAAGRTTNSTLQYSDSERVAVWSRGGILGECLNRLEQVGGTAVGEVGGEEEQLVQEERHIWGCGSGTGREGNGITGTLRPDRLLDTMYAPLHISTRSGILATAILTTLWSPDSRQLRTAGRSSSTDLQKGRDINNLTLYQPMAYIRVMLYTC